MLGHQLPHCSPVAVAKAMSRLAAGVAHSHSHIHTGQALALLVPKLWPFLSYSKDISIIIATCDQLVMCVNFLIQDF